MRKEIKGLPTSLSVAILATIALLSACSTNFSGDSVDYKSQGEKKIPNLAIPPDLSTQNVDKRYTVSDGTATLSQYNSVTGKDQKEVVTGSTVTPEQLGIKVERDGQRRWLVVSKPAEDIYPKVKSFWEDSGFLIVTDSPATGIMETDWAENRANVPDDMIRRFLGKNLDSLYSTSLRDKFRTRLEKNTTGATEIYVAHRGAEEKLMSMSGNSVTDTSVWVNRPNDPELEAAMLTRMMIYLGTDAKSAKAAVAATAGPAKTRISRVTQEGEQSVLTINQGFDKAWREVGLALDRSNFTVEDRDRSKGVYYVRYVNSKNMDQEKSSGWFSGWFKSSKEDELKKAKRYQVVVKSNADVTRVIALDEKGAVVLGDADQQILKSIDEQVSY
jgi:outer membrane protein assembly factor BamC